MMILRHLITTSRRRARPSGRAPCMRAIGFTTVELMVALTVAAIMFGIAMPQFQNMISDQRVQSASSSLYASLIFARSEAIKRSQFVAVCAMTADGSGCQNSTDWTRGWIVFVDGDGDGFPGAVADILKRQDALSGVTLTGTGSNVSYQRDGRLRAAATTFIASPAPANASIKARCVSLDLSGRPKTITDRDGNVANGCQ
jgi:type IV fimbrial biogenesis protein FimT